MRILVTGGSGYIGGYVVAALQDAGHDVWNLDIREPGGTCWFHCVDVADRAAVRKAASHVKPEAVVHLAGLIDARACIDEAMRYYRVNVAGSLNVLEAVVTHKAPVVFASSAAVYGPRTPYSASKSVIEMALRALQQSGEIPHYTVLRLFNVSGGEEQHSPETHLIPRAVAAALSGSVLQVNGNCTRDYVHVEDVARAFVQAAEGSGSASPLDIGTGQGTSTKVVLDLVREQLDGLLVEYGPTHPLDSLVLVADTLLTRQDLNWHPQHDLTRIVRDTAEFQVKKRKETPQR